MEPEPEDRFGHIPRYNYQYCKRENKAGAEYHSSLTNYGGHFVSTGTGDLTVSEPVGLAGSSREATVARAPARERVSWALYEFANTVFSMNMTTLFFSVWMVSDLHRSL